VADTQVPELTLLDEYRLLRRLRQLKESGDEKGWERLDRDIGTAQERHARRRAAGFLDTPQNPPV